MLQLREHRIEYASRSDEFHLWHITDTHLGHKGTDEKALKATVARIEADPFALWTGGGDYGEYISTHDPRFDGDEIASWIDLSDLKRIGRVQSDRLIAMLRPIGNKCLGMIGGNHGLRMYRYQQFDPLGYIAGKLEVPNLGYDGAFIYLTFKRQGGSTRAYKLCLLHGWGGGRTAGAKKNKLRDGLMAFNAAILFMGHHHVRDRHAMRAWDCTAKRITTTTRVGIHGGGYLCGAGYSVRAGYPPAEIGSVCVNITPDKNRIEVNL